MTNPFIPTLLFAPGTCARVSLTALEETGAPFETQLVAFMAGEHRAPDFLAVNPAGKVPVLLTEDGPITQTCAILWYLAARHPGAGLLPDARTPMEQAKLLAWLGHFAADLHPLVTRIVVPFLLVPSPEAQREVRESAATAMAFQLGALESRLTGTVWLLGDAWSVLDSYLGWIWFRITGVGFDRSAFPAIAAHYARLSDRPAVQRCLAREKAAQADLAARGLAAPNINNG
jgi:glutathione S-transferase